MNKIEKEKNAKAFSEFWANKGYEKGESQKFWLSLLRDVLGVSHPEAYIFFEDQVKLDHTSFIDGFIPSTHVLIEQKGTGKDLTKAIKQSDGSLLTPFQQAKRYSSELPYSQRPRWIITCNFQEFLIYDMEKPNGEPEKLLLKNLEKEYYRLEFIVNSENENIKREMEISIKAGEIVGLLYDALLKQYNDKDENELKSLNELCVRLVFCFYAEDSGLFGNRLAFHDYLNSFKAKDARRALIDLFKVLDTKPENRDKYLDEDLAKFPYVNGGLFANENIIIPQLTQEIIDIILHRASEDFDWSEISPTIFGAVFESTLNPQTRRSGGMHYTSIENIHKVIDPLFLDDLKEELAKIKEIKVEKQRKQELEAYRKKLSTLNFLDPACGSGNFLTETYISLRRLENEALALEIDSTKNLTDGQIVMGFDDTIKVSIGQFYGIEINDFAVTVAKTALWISEAQMMHETEMIVNHQIDFFPLKSYANIIEANALRIDWNTVIPKEKLSYIMGNPPFVGYKLQNFGQKQDMQNIFGNIKNLDYVCCWYGKACEYIINSNIKVAFVSTNSIVQGENAITLFPILYKNNIKINFAHQTFKWDSESNKQAAVHCVIIGFSMNDTKEKILFSNNSLKYVENINCYLLDAPNIIVQKRSKPLCEASSMVYGSEPREGGFLIFDNQEKHEILNKEPNLNKYIRRFVSSDDYINNNLRFCFWLKNADIKEIRQSKILMERLKQTRIFRENSKQAQAHAAAQTPYLFASERQPEENYLLIPVVSSERRKYIPIGYVDKNIIASNACFTVANATLYEFGVLTSNVHNAWTRVVCGRLKSDYRYSNTIVYNNFPWPTPNEKQKETIEKTAQMILDARALYPDSSLADLYDEITMPVELRKAHQENDKAVMAAYGFNYKTMTESECVAELMKLYQKLTAK